VRIDLNSDMGEGYGRWSLGDDDALLEIVTSANIACGFHAGDPSIMRRTTAAAASRGVRIGAHVSYPDLRGFGRRNLDVPPAEVTDDVLYQIGALDAFARASGEPVSYVKAHGALYNRMADDGELAGAVIEASRLYDRPLALVVLAGSQAEKLAAEAGVHVVGEAFADRSYTADGRLVSRKLAGAVLDDPASVAARAVAMVTTSTVLAADGSRLPLAAGSLCVHGDSPNAVSLARAVRRALEDAGVEIAPFVGDPVPRADAVGRSRPPRRR